jgi:pSer/pThr/pTyr-binding forkhead associated (FHA) protein
MGVSRNHAVLTYKDNRLYIHDVGSVNGTWLNGQRLKPYELYALTPGTPVSLGQLTIYIYY